MYTFPAFDFHYDWNFRMFLLPESEGSWRKEEVECFVFLFGGMIYLVGKRAIDI